MEKLCQIIKIIFHIFLSIIKEVYIYVLEFYILTLDIITSNNIKLRIFPNLFIQIITLFID